MRIAADPLAKRSSSGRAQRVNAWLRRLVVHERDRWHWPVAISLIVLGLYAGQQVARSELVQPLRSRVYQALQRTPRSRGESTNVALVFIGDEEYWRGKLAARVPLKKTYLGELVERIADASPSVIALDLDLRAQSATLVQHDDYRCETLLFVAALERAAAKCHCTIVLPTTVLPTGHGDYTREADVLQPFARRLPQPKFVHGYIDAPLDIRHIAMPLPLHRPGDETAAAAEAGGPAIDSFAAAITRVLKPRAIERAGEEPFSYFRSRRFFPEMSASRALADPEPLQHKAVIIGGRWSALAEGRGERVDTHLTPVGPLPGAMVHANYVEALLNNETRGSLSRLGEIAVEIAASLAVAILFVRAKRRLRWIVGMNLAAIVFSYALWNVAGVYFDFVVPVVLLSAHEVVEQTLEWRKEAQAHRHCTQMQHLEAAS